MAAANETSRPTFFEACGDLFMNAGSGRVRLETSGAMRYCTLSVVFIHDSSGFGGVPESLEHRFAGEFSLRSREMITGLSCLWSPTRRMRLTVFFMAAHGTEVISNLTVVVHDLCFQTALSMH
jgi:hypothetical protein